MDGRKPGYLLRRSHLKFKKKGGGNRGGRQQQQGRAHDTMSPGHTLRDPDMTETSYCLLCPSSKIGSVLGRGGGIVNMLRQETHAKITVSEAVHGSDERVVLIYSSSKRTSSNGYPDVVVDDNDESAMAPRCPAQDALLKIHDRITAEDDRSGRMANIDDAEGDAASVRLLVPNILVGCIIGKHGDVIQKLRSVTRANIRVLPISDRPADASVPDELVQISGPPDIVRKALYRVSTLLHENPRKDQLAPAAVSLIPWIRGNPRLPSRGDATGPDDRLPPRNDWPWMDERPPPPPPPQHHTPVPPPDWTGSTSEFSMKMLCSVRKIPSVIGRRGATVKQLEHDTGAVIHADDNDFDERVIRVSCLESLRNPRSETIEAVLLLQGRINEDTEKGVAATRLLVPSSKVGCILGQGGQVINDMRRRTQADIRVCPKEANPPFVPSDEELVQISGSIRVVREALGEIASRLRTRYLRDATDAPPVPPYHPNTEPSNAAAASAAYHHHHHDYPRHHHHAGSGGVDSVAGSGMNVMGMYGLSAAPWQSSVPPPSYSSMPAGPSHHPLESGFVPSSSSSYMDASYHHYQASAYPAAPMYSQSAPSVPGAALPSYM